MSGGWNITILAGLSLVAPHAEASVVPNADPRVFTRRLALRLRIEDKGVRDSSGRVGARSARPRERSQERQEEQGPPGAQTHELHGSTGEKTLLWRKWRKHVLLYSCRAVVAVRKVAVVVRRRFE